MSYYSGKRKYDYSKGVPYGKPNYNRYRSPAKYRRYENALSRYPKTSSDGGRYRRRSYVPIPKMVSKNPRAGVGYVRNTGGYRFRGPVGSKESKWFDTEFATEITEDGAIIIPSLNLLTGGTGNQQVIGRECVVNRIQVRLKVFAPIIDLGNWNVKTTLFYKFVLILDTQANGQVANVDDVFELDELTLTNSIHSYMNLRNDGRFRVLATRRVKVVRDVTTDHTSVGSAPNDDVVVAPTRERMDPIHMDVDIPLTFGPVADGTIGSVKTNNLMMIGFSSNDATQGLDQLSPNVPPGFEGQEMPLATAIGVARIRFSNM